MKKLIQASLVVVLMLILLQAVVGVTLVSADKTASYENVQYTAAATSGQSVQVLICSRTRLAYCAMPNVGWNSVGWNSVGWNSNSAVWDD